MLAAAGLDPPRELGLPEPRDAPRPTARPGELQSPRAARARAAAPSHPHGRGPQVGPRLARGLPETGRARGARTPFPGRGRTPATRLGHRAGLFREPPQLGRAGAPRFPRAGRPGLGRPVCVPRARLPPVTGLAASPPPLPPHDSAKPPAARPPRLRLQAQLRAAAASHGCGRRSRSLFGPRSPRVP